MAIFFFCLLLSTFPSSIFSLSLQNFRTLSLPAGVTSPTSIAFRSSPLGISPFTGVWDGEALRYDILLNAFVPYGFTSPNRDDSCNGQSDPDKLPTCGLPLGVGFGPRTGKLYVLDAYYGLGAIGLLGGKAEILLPTTSGRPYNLLIPIDVDKDEIIRFADVTSSVTPWEMTHGTRISGTDCTGTVYEFDPFSKEVKPLLTKLCGPVGITTDADATFLLTSQKGIGSISKYYLKGENAGTSEVILELSAGELNKITRNREGNFWVIVNNFQEDRSVVPEAVKIDSSGNILATVDLSNEYQKPLTTAQENDGKLYIGGAQFAYVGRYDIVS